MTRRRHATAQFCVVRHPGAAHRARAAAVAQPPAATCLFCVIRGARGTESAIIKAMVRWPSRLDRLAALVLAAVMALAGTASVAGRQTMPDKCTREAHQCGPSLIACCCVGQPDGSPAPTSTPSNRAQLTAPDITAQVAPGSPMVLPDSKGATARALSLHSPPHGFRFVELPILLSTFLI